MTSITKIIILITAIIANSGYALDVLGDDINQPTAQVSDTPSNVKRDQPYLRRCDDISGCVTTDGSLDYPINRDYHEVMRPKGPRSLDSKNAISKLSGLRERRQAVVKTKGSDDGPNSVVSLLARSSSPLRSMIRNRNRRTIPETSSNKNTRVEKHTKDVTNRIATTMSNTKRLLMFLVTTLTSPIIVITPEFIDNTKLYTS
ncbi:unnamed protein product [Macrosiphum euphorbiae]|uniref:Uncharacterized protein n=1 Tax=Macrosiphum euphorbiae TaxID=13131 RepID=A0AAV0WKW9_9HEMI|nr:unnamed protein product [Macrosiphum euphorbiae]